MSREQARQAIKEIVKKFLVNFVSSSWVCLKCGEEKKNRTSEFLTEDDDGDDMQTLVCSCEDKLQRKSMHKQG